LVRRQAKRLAFLLQASALIAGLVVIALLVEALKAIGQDQIAQLERQVNELEQRITELTTQANR